MNQVDLDYVRPYFAVDRLVHVSHKKKKKKKRTGLPVVLVWCSSASQCESCRTFRRWDCCTVPLHSHCGLNIHREAGTPPSFPSLPSGGNRVLGSPKWFAIFTTLCSIWGLLPGDLLPAAFPKPRNLTLGLLSPDVMENIWPAAWLQGLAVQPYSAANP